MNRAPDINDSAFPAARGGWLAWHRDPDEAVEDRALTHAWCCNLDESRLSPFCDDSTLSAEEWHRAGRFGCSRQRNQFVRRRALRRYLLGKFLNLPPGQVRFTRSAHGKPLLSQSEHVRLDFSTSQSDNIFVMAVLAGARVGVDVEVLRPEWDWESVARMHVAPSHLVALHNRPWPERQETFLRFWSLREALSKAVGVGIACPANEPVPLDRLWDLALHPERNLPSSLPERRWLHRCDRIAMGAALVTVVRSTS